MIVGATFLVYDANIDHNWVRAANVIVSFGIKPVSNAMSPLGLVAVSDIRSWGKAPSHWQQGRPRVCRHRAPTCAAAKPDKSGLNALRRIEV